jgi:hypothetical protein
MNSGLGLLVSLVSLFSGFWFLYRSVKTLYKKKVPYDLNLIKQIRGIGMAFSGLLGVIYFLFHW